MASKGKKAPVNEKESGSSEIIRKFKANPALYVGSVFILVLVTITFLAGDLLFRGSGGAAGDLTFGYYDKAPISWVPGNYFAQYQEQVARFYQGSIDENNFHLFSEFIWQQAFETAAVHTAILQEVKKSNFSVPEKTVDRNVAQLPQFQINGRFSAALYQQMSDTSRLALWRQVHDELNKIQYFNDLFGLRVPAGEAEFIGNMALPMRNFDVVTFLVDDFPASEYLAYAEENADLFRSIHLSRITVNSSEREARRVLASIIDETSTFEDTARAQSQDFYSDRGGDMGIRYVFELEREIPNAGDREIIFSLGKGELSDVIRVDESWVFFRVEDELKQADFEDEVIMDRVRSYMRNFQRGRMEDWAIMQAREFIADAQVSGFDNAVNWRSKEKNSFGPLPVNFGSIDLFTSLESFSIPDLSGQELTDLSRNINFWSVAFSTELNTPSEPLVQGSKVIVLQPTEQIETEEDRTEEIIENYSSNWLGSMTEQSLLPYFMNSAKMDNRFRETYYRVFAPGN